MKATHTLIAAVALSFATTGANATLTSVLSGQAINDTDLNVTWLADANVNPRISWTQAQSWIESLNSENGGVGHLGFHNWRLPSTLQLDASCGSAYYGSASEASAPYSAPGCTGSEMGHLFYNELGGVTGSSIAAIHNANFSMFSNLQFDAYWSGTESALGSEYAWLFTFNYGIQVNYGLKDMLIYALAVRDGQVAAVSAPAAAWLLGSGLLGLVGVASRKTA